MRKAAAARKRFHGHPFPIPQTQPQTPCVPVSRPPAAYARSPRIRRASWMSFGMMVTRLAWMAQRFCRHERVHHGFVSG